MLLLTLMAGLCAVAHEGIGDAKAEPELAPPDCQPRIAFDAAKAAMLAQSVIMAIQHANQTGNYSVLRDLGTPAFRGRFPEARLSILFKNIRNLGVNLSAIMTHLQLLNSSGLIAPDRLYVAGEMSAPALQVRFELLFVITGGVWHIEGLAIDTLAVNQLDPVSQKENRALVPGSAPG